MNPTPSGHVLVMPSSPALVQELAPADQPSHQLRDAARSILRPLQDLDIEIVGSQSEATYTAHEGSFRAWGAPQVQVGGGHYLAELLARYVVGNTEGRVRSMRTNIGSFNSDCITIVLVDGSAGLTARAPLALLDTASASDQWCQEVLEGKKPAAWTRQQLIDAGVLEPELWLELAAIIPSHAQLVHADTSTGVGRYIATWEV